MPKDEANLSEALSAATNAINADRRPATADEASAQITTSADELATIAAGVQDASTAVAAPYVYNTETTEVARTFINQIDRLSRLIREDDLEIELNEKERDRQIHELQLRFEEEQDAILNNCRQANEIAMARRADRANARGAVQKVVDDLQTKQ